MSLIRLLFVIVLIAQVFPIYPFRKTHFLNYFIVSALIDPIFYLIRRHIITIDTYTYFLIATMVLFVAFPYKDLKVKVFLFIPLLLTLLHYEYNHFISLIGIELVSVFMIYQLIEYFYDEIKQDEKGSLFLLIIMLLTLLDAIKIFLYFEYIYISVLLYPFFVTGNIILLIVMSITGVRTKIKIPSFFLQKMNVKNSENGIPLNNDNLELARKKVKSFDYGLTEREIDVLKLLADGLTSQEISGKLFLSKKTVDYYRGSIRLKLNIQKKSELITFYNTNIENTLPYSGGQC